MPLLSEVMLDVILGGNASKAIHFQNIDMQVSHCYHGLDNFDYLWMQVNVAKGQTYILANISITLVTLLVNLWAAIVILRKEKTRIHTLIVYDCAVNVVSSVHTALYQKDMQKALILIQACFVLEKL